MVFGRKKSNTPAVPVPPSVEQILDDLRAAPNNDPVYSLNPELLEELVDPPPEDEFDPEDLSNPSALCQKVAEYVAARDTIGTLAERIGAGFEALVCSQAELEQLTGQVQAQLDAIREKRKKFDEQQGGGGGGASGRVEATERGEQPEKPSASEPGGGGCSEEEEDLC